jgi:3-phosphoshikimate 1-carboxyvinyltransferase
VGNPVASETAAYLDLGPIARTEGRRRAAGIEEHLQSNAAVGCARDRNHGRRGLLDADDVDRMRDALSLLGVQVEQRASSRDFLVHGTGGAIPAPAARLFLGNAGTAFRPLTAVLALTGGAYELTGVARMHERPIGDLVDALCSLGADIRYLDKPGFPPLAIGSSRIDPANAPERAAVRGNVSSQFLSALLMALPLYTARTRHPITIDVSGELISRPYVAITTNLMRRFGVTVSQDEWRSFQVPASATYTSPGTIRVEGDASTASYFLAAGAIGGGPVRVTGVGRHSIQGDVAFADVLARMGADVRYGDDWIEARSGESLNGATVDCVAIPDAAMTLAVVALFARGPTTLTGIASWRVKETDRIAAMATELRKVGATLRPAMIICVSTHPLRLRSAVIDTYDDHRIAMCFSLAALGDVPAADQRSRVRAEDVSRIFRRVRADRAAGAGDMSLPPGPPQGRLAPAWREGRASAKGAL